MSNNNLGRILQGCGFLYLLLSLWLFFHGNTLVDRASPGFAGSGSFFGGVFHLVCGIPFFLTSLPLILLRRSLIILATIFVALTFLLVGYLMFAMEVVWGVVFSLSFLLLFAVPLYFAFLFCDNQSLGID